MKSLLAALGLLVAPCIAYAHEAPPSHAQPLGWEYDPQCCSGRDCRPLPGNIKVIEGPGGYTVPSGELIPYGSTKIKQSKDEFFHWCTMGGLDGPNAHTWCLYVPPRAY